MTSGWWDDLRQAYLEALEGIDESLRDFLEQALDSGATSPEEAQAALDRQIAAIPDPDVRRQVIEDLAEKRAQLTESIRDSGFTGDLESLTLAQLAALAGERAGLALEGDAQLPDESAVDAAGLAALATGSFVIDPNTGGITIFDRAGNVHERIAPGHEARPAEIVAGEIMTGSAPGGPRASLDDIRAAVGALTAAGWDPSNPGDAGLEITPEGDVVATFPDGSSTRWEHDPLRQTLEDLDASAGSPRDIGAVLDRGGTQFGETIVGAVRDTVGSFWSSPGGAGGDTTGGGARGTGRGGATDGDGGGDSGPGGATGRGSGVGSAERPDDFTWMNTGRGSGSPSSSPTVSTAASPSTDESQTNEIVERTRDDDEPAEGEEDDGWRPSTIAPPTDATVPNDADRDDGSGDGDDDEPAGGEEEDEEGDEEGSTDTEFTPAPDAGSGGLTGEEALRLAGLAPVRGADPASWDDGMALRPRQYDPAFALAMEERKQAMVGNPGPDGDSSPPAGPPPSPPTPGPDPDDDANTPTGHDTGKEDPMQQHHQGPIDMDAAGRGGEDEGAVPDSIAPQAVEEAELDDGSGDASGPGSAPSGWDYALGNAAGGTARGEPQPGSSEPLETAGEADLDYGAAAWSLPGYDYALGAPAGGDPAVSDGGDPTDPSTDDWGLSDRMLATPGQRPTLPGGLDPAALSPVDDEPENG